MKCKIIRDSTSGRQTKWNKVWERERELEKQHNLHLLNHKAQTVAYFTCCSLSIPLCVRACVCASHRLQWCSQYLSLSTMSQLDSTSTRLLYCNFINTNIQFKQYKAKRNRMKEILKWKVPSTRCTLHFSLSSKSILKCEKFVLCRVQTHTHTHSNNNPK